MIRPTFLSFETAKRAIAIGQLGLDTVGHNIANTQTPGYTRQRVDQVSLNSAGGAMKFTTFGTQFPGQGATVKAITQIRDPYLDNRYRMEATSYGELGIRQSGLTDINNIFDEIQTNGLHAKMGDLYTAIDKLLAQADSKELAMVVRNTANELVQIINQNANDLAIARQQQTNDLKTTVSAEVNDLLEKIADLNVRIKEDHFYGNPSNELQDARNLLIDRLAEYVDIQIVRTPVQIAADHVIDQLSIELKNSGRPPEVPNVVLVDSGSFNKFEVREDDNGFVSIHVVDGISGFPINAKGIDFSNASDEMRDNMGDVTLKLFRGGLKGFLDVINGVGPTTIAQGSNTFRGIPYYQASLDEYAAMLAEAFNRVNNITEQESERSGGMYPATKDENLFVPRSLTIAAQPDPPWMQSIAPGTLELSGKNYAMTFAAVRPGDANYPGDPIDPDAPDYVSVTMDDGSVYFAEVSYDADGQMQKLSFMDDGKVVFSIMPTEDATLDSLTAAPVIVDARITASNISISQSWLDDPLYMTASKEKPATLAEPKLEIAGTPPAWMRSIDFKPKAIPEDYDPGLFDPADPNTWPPMQKIPDNRYLFKETSAGDAVIMEVYDPDTKTTRTFMSSPADQAYPWARNTSINFYELLSGSPNDAPPDLATDSTFSITTSANANAPAPGGGSTTNTHVRLDAQDTRNILSLKNVTAAANDNIFKFKELFTETNTFTNAAFSGTFENFLINMQSDASLDHKANTSKLDASFVVISTLADRRDAVSAVSIDEEGISMMQYQNFYNAAARYMTALDEALDRIINGMGVVGR